MTPSEVLRRLLGEVVRLTQRLRRVNANVDVAMATADEKIRVSDRVKRELNRLRREGESYNDVLEPVLNEN